MLKKTTVYINADLYEALRLKESNTSQSFSSLVNEAVRHVLEEDAEDLAAFEETAHEPYIRFEDVLKKLSTREN
ncbi:MAG: CopG family transcriptional regulator [SAR202 cluster bacterium]|nr:CopG family transcriptional regulator [SAR202 cluster bacterium]